MGVLLSYILSAGKLVSIYHLTGQRPDMHSSCAGGGLGKYLDFLKIFNISVCSAVVSAVC